MSEGKWHRRLGTSLILLLFGGAAWVLSREFAGLEFSDVRASFDQIPGARLTLAMLLTVVSYFVLTSYDTIAVRYIGRELSYPRTALASFAGYVFSHNIGMSIVGAAAARYRFYSAWGFTATDVGRIVIFTSTTFWLGFLAVAGVVFVAIPPPAPAEAGIPANALRPLGLMFLGGVALYVVATQRRRESVRVRGIEFPVPSRRTVVEQLTVSIADWIAAASVFLALVPTTPTVGPETVLGVFLLAQTAALISHVPGGVGIFESVIVLGLGDAIPKEDLVGILCAYRIIYYVTPFIAGALLLGLHEAWRGIGRPGDPNHLGVRVLSALTPRVFAFGSLVAGTVLLMSSSFAAVERRLDFLEDHLPIQLVEGSHFAASLVGVSLLFISRALLHRIATAWSITLFLLLAGAISTLLKGLDYEEATLLFLLFAALWPCRPEFHRAAPLLAGRVRAAWTVVVAISLISSIALGWFVHHHTPYTSELWWTFGFDHHAARFLRASMGAIGLTLLLSTIVAIARRRAPGPLGRASRFHLGLADAPPQLRSVLLTATRREIPDLREEPTYLWTDRGGVAFVQRDEFCILLSDPQGERAARQDLAWTLREYADARGLELAVWFATTANIELYFELGLNVTRLGDDVIPDSPTTTKPGDPTEPRYLAARGGVTPQQCQRALFPSMGGD